MDTYTLKSDVTARTKNGNDAGKISGNIPAFESATTMEIRGVLHRKIESGRYLDLYVPNSACVKVTVTPPPVDPPIDPPLPPAEERIHIEFEIVNGVVDSVTVGDRVFKEL